MTAVISGSVHLLKSYQIGEFLHSHFNIEVEENTQHFWHIMLIISKEVKTQLKPKKRFCAVYGEGAVTDIMCHKWFAKFCAGDFSLDDAPWSGRPMEVDNDQIETLIENNQCYTTGEIADILKISKSIKLLVKMNNVSFTEKT